MRLEIFDRLGVGDTYRGLLWPAKRPVAVRKLSSWSTLSIAHLHAAAESIAQLQHPNIVELIGIQDNPAEPCLIFEWVDGMDLRQLLAHAPLPMSAALHITRGVMSALAHAHSYGVVHGRLSPSKVLVSRMGDVKVTGLGVHKSTRSPLTAGEALHSVLPYVSPEQLRGDIIDHRSDIFIAGVLLYQLLTGRSPFGATNNEMLRTLLSGGHRPIRQLAPHLPTSLDRLMARLLSPRSARYQVAEEVLAEVWRIDPEATGHDALIGHLDRHPVPRLPPNDPTPGGQSLRKHADPRVNRHQLQERLGHGGMGEVWRGTRRLGNGPPQTVAFKFVRDRLLRGRALIKQMEQIEREARTAMILHHPNIAAVYDVAEIDGQPCIVMEYVDGIDLRRLSRGVSLPANLVRCILRDVLSGLRHAHESGVLHRDLSPANIMIDRDGVARLMDFGVARNLHDMHSLGLLVGTPPFMAPETLELEEWSPASDIYSLGAVFYAVLTGSPPYGSGNQLNVLRKMQSRVLRPLPDSVPADLRAFVMAALNASPEHRQLGYAAVVAALGPVGRADRALLAAEVRRAMDEPSLIRPGSASLHSAADADTDRDSACGQRWAGETCHSRDDTHRGRSAPDSRRLASAFPAQAGGGHDTSTESPTIRHVSGILPPEEVATGMSFDPITEFLDTLYAWYQAGEPASGDEVTPVRIDRTRVHEAYHQLDQTLRDESAVEWSHFLQVCEIRPAYREGIWLAIENLVVKLGFDLSYFDGEPQPAEPEPAEIEEQPATERDLKWAKFIYYSLHKDVHGHRPDGIAEITKNMDDVQRFLAQLGAIVVSLPALSTEGFVPPPGESLPVLEQDVALLFRYHNALPEAGKEAIEREWRELASAVSSYTEARLQLRSLYDRMVEKLGQVMDAFEDAPTAPMHKVNGKTRLAVVRADSDSGAVTAPGALRVQVRQSSADRDDVELEALPTLPAGQGEPSFVGPVSLPEESSKWTKSVTRRIGLVGGTIAAMAAIAMVVLMPDTSRTSKVEVLEVTTIKKLPLEESDYPVCESSVQPVVAPTAPAIDTPTARPAINPKRRKSAKERFVSDIDTLLLTGKDESTYQLTLKKLPDHDGLQPKPAPTKPLRTRTVNLGELEQGQFDIEVSADDDISLVLGVAE